MGKVPLEYIMGLEIYVEWRRDNATLNFIEVIKGRLQLKILIVFTTKV